LRIISSFYSYATIAVECSSRILIPIDIKMIPPRISILFLKRCPSLLPNVTPRNDNRKVTDQIAIMGVIIDICRNAKLKPTAKASMLVATDNISRT
jgi:hypothetical protein